MENNKTAVEILCNELAVLKFQFDNEMISVMEYLQAKKQAEQKAKEIFRQQIKDAWTDGNKNEMIDGKLLRIMRERYYNETYGS